MKKILSIILFYSILVQNVFTQKQAKYYPIEIYANSAKVSPAAKIFDECYAIGYNINGQFLYGYLKTTDAADHNGFGIILYNTNTQKETKLVSYAMEDSLNTFETFKDFFIANRKKIATYIKTYKIENKKPIVKTITKNEYTLTQKCKTEYDWFNCNYKATFKNEKSFNFTVVHTPYKDAKPSLYKLITFYKYNVILYNTTQRGWEGVPHNICFGLH